MTTKYLLKKIYVLTPLILVIFFFQNCSVEPSSEVDEIEEIEATTSITCPKNFSTVPPLNSCTTKNFCVIKHEIQVVSYSRIFKTY